MVNPKMVFSYRYYCLDLPVTLVYCQMKGCESHLHNVCQGEYAALHGIDLDGALWSGRFFTIVLMSFGWKASLRNWRRCNIALRTELTHHLDVSET